MIVKQKQQLVLSYSLCDHWEFLLVSKISTSQIGQTAK